MIIAADANVLIDLVTSKNDYRVFYQLFEKNHYKLALLTPVIAEFFVRDESFERLNFLNKVNSFTQTFPLDYKASLVTAEITRKYIEQGSKESSNDKNNKGWQGTKIDIQILGICIANNIPRILTEDKGISSIINALDLPIEVVDMSKVESIDLPLFSDNT